MVSKLKKLDRLHSAKFYSLSINDLSFRLSTIRSADTIVALKDGKVAEIGTHNELMKARGLYFQLVTAQVLKARSDGQQKRIKMDDSLTGRILHVHKISAYPTVFYTSNYGGLKDPKKQPIHRRLDKRTACWLDRQAIWIENLKNDQSRKNPPSSTFCFC